MLVAGRVIQGEMKTFQIRHPKPIHLFTINMNRSWIDQNSETTWIPIGID